MVSINASDVFQNIQFTYDTARNISTGLAALRNQLNGEWRRSVVQKIGISLLSLSGISFGVATYSALDQRVFEIQSQLLAVAAGGVCILTLMGGSVLIYRNCKCCGKKNDIEEQATLLESVDKKFYSLSENVQKLIEDIDKQAISLIEISKKAEAVCKASNVQSKKLEAIVAREKNFENEKE